MAQTTFNFDQRTEELIRELKTHFGASTKAEVLRKALKLLAVAQDVQKRGRELGVVNKNKKIQVLVL